MATRGRKPKPTTLKVLAGTRADRINLAEPKAPPEPPACPAYLDDEARGAWEVLAPDLTASGVLTKLDGPALALYCSAFARWRMASDDIAAQGIVVFTEKGGVKANPAVAIAAAAETQMRALLVEFGCTPSSRSRVTTASTAPPADDFDAFVRKKG